MGRAEPTFTVGIEEEYLLIDRTSRDVVVDPPRELFAECQALAGRDVVEPELLRSHDFYGSQPYRRPPVWLP